MNLFLTEKVLDQSQIIEIKKTIDIIDKTNKWSDGMESVLGPLNYEHSKKNLEVNHDIRNVIVNIVSNSLIENFKFHNFTVPNNYKSVVSKTEAGGFYGPHMDHWNIGDFSTTVFLNDANEYEGGELCLYFGGEDEVKIKLNAGWSVTYPTGILHRVNKVTRGSRYVCVIWTNSLLKNTHMRQIYYELSNIENCISKNNNFYALDCLSAAKDPQFLIKNLKMQILRNYSKHV